MKPAGAACAACPARDAKCVPPEPAHGRPRLAIVGEAPGRTELQEGRPFIGASGKMLGRGLATLGLKRSDIHWTNAILCDCPQEGMAKAAKCCRQRLQAELAASGAPVVMPVGAWGLQGALGATKKPGILAWRGTINPHNYGGEAQAGNVATEPGSTPGASTGDGRGPWPHHRNGSRSPTAVPTLVCPTVHPAFVMRSPAYGPILRADVARIGRVMREGFTPPELAPGRRLVIARTTESLQLALSQLLPGAPVSFDVETVGLGPTATALVCFGLSDGVLTIVVPWSRGRDGKELWWGNGSHDVARWVSDALASRVCITHNGPAFDHIVAHRYGIRIGAWDDTLLVAHATAGHLKKNLAHVVTTCGDGALTVSAWKEWEDRTADLERLWEYNGRDCLYTILAWHEVRGIVQPRRAA